MKPGVCLFGWLLLAMACSESPGKKDEIKIAGTQNAPGPEVLSPSQKDTVPQNIQIDSVIHLSFATGSDSVTVKGHLDRRGEPVVCYLPVVQGKRLMASVTPENKKATIRFSHISLPDGTSDGPFGPVLKYKLEQRGLYKIYVGANMMAGDPASTDFVLKVKVQ
jgi:hypothetical protein